MHTSHSPCLQSKLWSLHKEMHGMAATPTCRDHPSAAVRLKEDKKIKMVQEFMVLRCYQCEAFQVQQVKKVAKWSCKCCNEKQSIIKEYGRGKASDCRKHVQKMNMLRGEGEREIGAPLLGSQHPPEDYASTFSLDEAGKKDKRPDHPVVVAGKTNGRSKWSTFIDVQDSDEEEDSSHTTKITQANKRVKRSDSDRITARRVSETTPTDKVTPYSAVNQDMEQFLNDHTPTMSASKSLHTLTHDSYRRLDIPSPPPSTDIQSHSMFDLRGHSYHDDIQTIHKDISRYSRPPKESEDFPKSSSRWSQFTCLEEESGDEGESGRSRHLTGTSTMTQFTMSRTN